MIVDDAKDDVVESMAAKDKPKDYILHYPDMAAGGSNVADVSQNKIKSSLHSNSHLGDRLDKPQKDNTGESPEILTPTNLKSGNRSILSKGGLPEKNKIDLIKKDRNVKPRFTIGGEDIINLAKKKKYTTIAERQYSIQMQNIARTLGELERANSIVKKERNMKKPERKTRIDEYLFNLQMGGMGEHEKLMQIDFGLGADKTMTTTMQQSKGLSSQYTLKLNNDKNQITLHTMMKIMTANDNNWLKSTRHMKTRKIVDYSSGQRIH